MDIGFSTNGADFSKMRGHTSLGYRLIDSDTKVPGTNTLFLRAVERRMAVSGKKTTTQKIHANLYAWHNVEKQRRTIIRT